MILSYHIIQIQTIIEFKDFAISNFGYYKSKTFHRTISTYSKTIKIKKLAKIKKQSKTNIN